MTEFGTDELIDCIRHNIALLDESGFADRVILSPRRHAVPGGLSLEMCQEYGEDEVPSLSHFELEKQSTHQELYPENSSPRINSQIREKLLLQLDEIESSGRLDKAALPSHQIPSKCTLNFVSKNPVEFFDKQKSLTTRLLTQEKFNLITDNLSFVPSFAEFAKFEAMEGTAGAKKFNIVFPAINSGEESHILTINILKTAFIDDLIGLACHIYTRRLLNPSCESPSMYDLYLAEEDLSDFDIELPPQDRRRRVADCGFSNLAIVKRSFVKRRLSQQSWKQNIRIYLVDGRCYTMDNVEGISLRKVFEYALQRKKEEDYQMNNTEVRLKLETIFHDIEYKLEPLNWPGLILDLNQSVSSSGMYDFMFIRMNSSRGDFDLATQDPTDLLRKPSNSMDFSQMLNSCKDIETPICFKGIDTETFFSSIDSQICQYQLQILPLKTSSTNQMASILHDGGSVLEEYSVHKLHRFKPKTLLRFVIREKCLELIKIGKMQKDNINRKIKRIPWKLIASVEVPPTSEKRNYRFVRITFLVCIQPALLQHIFEAEKIDNLPQIFKDSYWKVLFIEASAHEAWKIGLKLNEQLDIRPSNVNLIYRYSLRASLKPKIAAEKAFGIQKQFPSSTSSSAVSSISKSEKGLKKKLSAIFFMKKF